MEAGDPGVSMGIYATVLYVLGMLERMGSVADAAHDRPGPDLADQILPQGIRHRRTPPARRRTPP